MSTSALRLATALFCALLLFLGTISFTSTGLRVAHRAAHTFSLGVTHRAPGLAAYLFHPSSESETLGLPYDAVRHAHVDFAHDGQPIPRTRVLAHVAGFTVLDNLYVREGRLYLVSDNSTGDIPHNLQNIMHDVLQDERTGIEELATTLLTSDAASRKALGGYASRMQGTTMLFNNDAAKSTLHRMPHFVEEALFGSWRVYSSLVGYGKKGIHIDMPDRLWLPKLDEKAWRDAGVLLNPYILRSAFPGLGMLYKEDWDDIAQFGNTLLLERVILYDRAAARSTVENQRSGKVIENIAALPCPDDWWEPIRASVVAASIGGKGHLAMSAPDIPVITYVSRQHSSKRRFRAADHVGLIHGLEALAATGRVEVNVVAWETMSRQTQIAIASRTTVMLGAHGSGLAHALWMPPDPKAMVLEAFKEGGFARDYGLAASMLGFKHVSMWGGQSFDFADAPKQQTFVDGFHGKDIELDAEAVLALIKGRLQLE